MDANHNQEEVVKKQPKEKRKEGLLIQNRKT